MSPTQTRRDLLGTLSSAAAVGVMGSETTSAQEAPPEVTTIRLAKLPGLCIAPEYVAEGLLKIEGFSDIQYVEVPLEFNHRSVGTDKIDVSIGFVANYIVELDLETPFVLLPGVDAGIDRPWAQYLCCIVAGNGELVRRYPVATKRALRAIAKATNFCAAEPEQAARLVAAKAYQYDYALQTMN